MARAIAGPPPLLLPLESRWDIRRAYRRVLVDTGLIALGAMAVLDLAIALTDSVIRLRWPRGVALWPMCKSTTLGVYPGGWSEMQSIIASNNSL